MPDRPLPRVLLWEPADVRVAAIADSPGREFAPVVLAGPRGSTCADWTYLHEGEIETRLWSTQTDPTIPTSPAEWAAAAVGLALTDGAIGGVTTESADVLRAGLRYVGARSTVCMSMLATPPAGRPKLRPLLLADCAVVPCPTTAQLVDIVTAAAQTWRDYAGDEPRIALLWSSTLRPGQGHASAPYPDVLEAIHQHHPGLCVEGGLQVDAAISQHVAAEKAPKSLIAGQADVLIFPDLVSANASYKLLQHACGYEITSITHGYRRPFFDVSRGCTAAEFRRSAELCAIAAGQGVDRASQDMLGA